MSAVGVQVGLDHRGVEFDVSVEAGEVLAVLGPNGVGKSTLLQLIAGLLRPDTGRITLGDTIVADTASKIFVPAHARGVAMLSQQAMLFPHMNVAANVAYAPRCKGLRRSAARAVALHWLEVVGATELARRRPAQLSGGQAQRVAIARALAAEPRVLLLDEPMGALDVAAAPALRKVVRDILQGTDRTAVIVTHDLLDALALADTVAVIENGRVVEKGPTRTVLTAPRSAFAARIAGINLIPGTVTRAGVLGTALGIDIFGHGNVAVGAAAIALFPPAAVAVHLEAPHASPRNVIPVTIAELDVAGPVVHVRGAEQPDGGTGLSADITTAAAAELNLAPGMAVHFVVKTQEVQIVSAGSAVP